MEKAGVRNRSGLDRPFGIRVRNPHEPVKLLPEEDPAASPEDPFIQAPKLSV